MLTFFVVRRPIVSAAWLLVSCTAGAPVSAPPPLDQQALTAASVTLRPIRHLTSPSQDSPWLGRVEANHVSLDTDLGSFRLNKGTRVLVTTVSDKSLHCQTSWNGLWIGGELRQRDVGRVPIREVRSSAPRPNGPIRIDTVEDFIQFVEFVEDMYPSAAPREVASEIRQLWYSRYWEGMINSDGILVDGRPIDLAQTSIRSMFDIGYLIHNRSGTVLTPFGEVSMGHVMAGIDAQLNGPSRPVGQRRESLERDRRFGYELVVNAANGRAREFSTWACDLGDAVSRGASGFDTLPRFGANPAELTGDIDGYTLVDVVATFGSTDRAGPMKISALLRDFYSMSPDEHRRRVDDVFHKSVAVLGGSAEVASAIDDCARLMFERHSLEGLRRSRRVDQAVAYVFRYDIVSDVDAEFDEAEMPRDIRSDGLAEATESYAAGSCVLVAPDGSRHAVWRGVPDLVHSFGGELPLFECAHRTPLDEMLQDL